LEEIHASVGYWNTIVLEIEMDQNGGSNQNLSHSNLCRSGCGFYGNPAFEGMCSKCYKDSVKRRQQNPSPTQIAGRMTPTVSSTTSSMTTVTETSLPSTSVETATPTIPSTSSSQEKNVEKAEVSAEAAAASAENNDNDEKEKKPPKKNRCHTCKKKVGLTGFECRCGGLYCGLHRYSDKHECTFDYKELAQQQIRKANPVVVGEKINKI